MADSFTSDTYEALCRDAEGYLARGLAEQARELLLKATDLIGTRPRARSLLADACMCLGLWEEAREQLEALSTLEINNIYTHFRLGQVLEELGDFELALDNYRVVADINPGHHGARVALARIEKPGAPDAGEAQIDKVSNGSQLFPDVPGEQDEIAGDEDGVDRLLQEIGMNGKAETEGVEELLSTMGIAPDEKEKKNEVRPSIDLDSIFGGTGKREEAPAEDLNSVFRQSPPPGEPAPDNDDSGIKVIFGGDDQEQDQAPLDFSSIFGPPRTEAQTDPSSEEPGQEADLSSIFGGSEAEAEEQASTGEPEVTEEEPPAEEPEVQEEPVAGEAEASEEPSPEADFSSIFGGSEAEAEEQASTGEPEVTEEEPPAEEPEVQEEPVAGEAEASEEPSPEADLSSIFGGSEAEAEEQASTGEPEVTEEEPPAEEPEVQEEPVAGEVEASEEEPPSQEPVSEESEPGLEGVPPVDSSYLLHSVENSEIPVLHLISGSVAVRRAFIVGMDAGIEIMEDEHGTTILSGSGTVLLGQGYESAVRMDYSDGMTARFDRLAVRPVGIQHESLGCESAPSLVRLSGSAEGGVLFFSSGRTRMIRISDEMVLKAGALVAADRGVVIGEKPGGWLAVSGAGRVLITS